MLYYNAEPSTLGTTDATIEFASSAGGKITFAAAGGAPAEMKVALFLER